MKILGIDTTTKFLCLGILDGSKIYEYNLEAGPRLSSLLSLTIKRSLDAARINIREIDYFAVSLGPGSFTGTRVGVAGIKGLSFALNAPVIGISSLDILAKNAPESNNFIIPVIDARRSLIYYSIYQNKNGRLVRLAPYTLSGTEDFLKKAKPRSIILGDAIGLYKDVIQANVWGAAILGRDYWYPKAHNIINLALEKIKDKKFTSPFKIKPIYLYPKECQIKNP